jgi:hypothetical protein
MSQAERFMAIYETQTTGDSGMRLHGLVGALILLVSGVALAAGDFPWPEFSYPEAGFAAQYPAEPTVETRDYPTAQVPGGSVKERVYSTNSGGVIYAVNVADFTRTQAQKDKTIEEAVKRIAARGTVTNDESSARIDFNYGRELRVEDTDGTSYTNAIFFIDNKLYQIMVTYPKGNTDPVGSSGIHFFQQAFRLLRS